MVRVEVNEIKNRKSIKMVLSKDQKIDKLSATLTMKKDYTNYQYQ